MTLSTTYLKLCYMNRFVLYLKLLFLLRLFAVFLENTTKIFKSKRTPCVQFSLLDGGWRWCWKCLLLLLEPRSWVGEVVKRWFPRIVLLTPCKRPLTLTTHINKYLILTDGRLRANHSYKHQQWLIFLTLGWTEKKTIRKYWRTCDFHPKDMGSVWTSLARFCWQHRDYFHSYKQANFPINACTIFIAKQT